MYKIVTIKHYEALTERNGIWRPTKDQTNHKTGRNRFTSRITKHSNKIQIENKMEFSASQVLKYNEKHGYVDSFKN